MNGSGLGYQENTALDVNSQYTVTVPDLEFAKAQVKATTSRRSSRSERSS